MAERRMFAKSVIGSARFLKMPPTSRLLYYDLGMQADDDGVVEAFPVMRLTGATEDDLRVLVSKGFVCVLNEDWVTYIADWKRNNYIQKDRYHPGAYRDLLVKILADTKCIQGVSKMDPEVRLGKVRIPICKISKNTHAGKIEGRCGGGKGTQNAKWEMQRAKTPHFPLSTKQKG